jgi:outer membrane protein assembly factor BamB
MFQNLLLVQYDQAGIQDGMSKFIALDSSSGNVVWETNRPVASSWTTPIIADINGRYQLITVANPWVIAYDPAEGTEIWRAKCMSGDAAPSPIYAGGLVFVIEPDTRLIAIKTNGRGDVTQTHIAWKTDGGGPNICSPVSNGDVVFMLFSEGLISCHKVTNGTKLWEKDLRENFLASPSLVGDKLYILNEEGVMFIIAVGCEYKELTRCELGEKCVASPAFAKGRIYIRGLKNLYSIGEPSQSGNPNR